MKTNYGFSRRGPDLVAEELATVLSAKTAFEFKALFLIVHANLRARNSASGGEEMLRLRAYEKLQNLVGAGIVKKVGKKYRGVGPGIAKFFEAAAEMKVKLAAGRPAQGSVAAPAAPAALAALAAPAAAVAPARIGKAVKVAKPAKSLKVSKPAKPAKPVKSAKLAKAAVRA